MNVIFISILVLGGIGIIAALLLYIVANKFRVEEDPRIDQIEGLLPGANCGGCGQSGCRAFATACVKATTLSGLSCPGGGESVMKKIGEIVGLAAPVTKPMIAVIKCNGTCEARPHRVRFDGYKTCAISSSVAAAVGTCPDGCLGCGDCVEQCPYDAMHMDAETGLPVVNQDKCVGCAVCVAACPRHLIELRPKGPRGLRVFVACSNKEKGAMAMKDCDNACIGCSKCLKECTHDAITINNFLAYIDADKCKLCRKCEAVCPRGSIHAVNFPVKKPAPVATA